MTSKKLYQEIEPTKTTETTINCDDDALEHQLTIECEGTVTAGTMAVAVKPAGSTTFTPLRDGDGAVLSLDLTAAPYTLRFDGRFSQIRITPTDYDGDSFTINAQGW